MFNEEKGRHYITKDKLITWQGRPAHLQIATDITDELDRLIMRRMEGHKSDQEPIGNAKFLDYMDFMPFDYDIKKDVMRYVVRHADGSSSQARIEDFSRALSESGLIHPDYKAGFLSGLKAAGASLVRGCYIYKADYTYGGEFLTYRADYFSTGSKAEGVTHIVGRVQRVQEEK